MQSKILQFEGLEEKKLFTADLGFEPPGMDVECRSEATSHARMDLLQSGSADADSEAANPAAGGSRGGGDNNGGSRGGGGDWLGNHNVQLLSA